MLARRSKNTCYTPNQTEYWLAWLAHRLERDEQTLFFIELMQPAWLSHKLWQRFDTWTGLMRGVLVGIAVGSIGTPVLTLVLLFIGISPILWIARHPTLTLIIMLCIVIVCALIFGAIGVHAAQQGKHPETIALVEKLVWSDEAMQRSVKIGLGVGILLHCYCFGATVGLEHSQEYSQVLRYGRLS